MIQTLFSPRVQATLLILIVFAMLGAAGLRFVVFTAYANRMDSIRLIASEPTWPQTELPFGDAAEHGFDTAALDAFTTYLQTERNYMNAFIVVHEGEIVYEHYGPERTPDMIEHVWSVSKSVSSALVGIALERGDLQSVDQRVGELLPAELLQRSDRRMQDVTLAQLMSLTAGIGCRGGDSCTGEAFNKVIARRLRFTPGSRWYYDTSSVQVLSAIMGQLDDAGSMQRYGENVLFEPLGFADLEWEMDEDGVTMAGRGLYARPRDLAKIGALYLNEGVWEGERLISAEFIQQSMTNQTPGSENDPEYGYLWWLGDAREYHAYTALGYGGQHIYIVPDLELAVVMTTNKGANYENHTLIGDFIVPALVD